MALKKGKISDVVKDSRNANKGTDLGRELVAKSFEAYGAGRSVVADKNMRLIGGNHALDGAKEAGIDDIIIVPTNGRQLVVVQRTDIDLDSKMGRELALADNRTAQANINLDPLVIEGLQSDFGVDLESLGIDMSDMGGPYFGKDYDEDDGSENMETGGGSGEGSGSGESYSENLFPLAITLNKAEKLAWVGFMKVHKFKTDTEAFAAIFQHSKSTFK